MNKYLIVYQEKNDPDHYHVTTMKGYSMTDILPDLIVQEITLGNVIIQVTIGS
jgi:hypothetical protein